MIKDVVALTAPGVNVTSRADVAPVDTASGASHGFHPSLAEIHTGLVAWGSGISPGAVEDLIRLTDVAPLVARLLGLSFDTADGRLPDGFVKSATEVGGASQDPIEVEISRPAIGAEFVNLDQEQGVHQALHLPRLRIVTVAGSG